jgi:hypothetical protein
MDENSTTKEISETQTKEQQGEIERPHHIQKLDVSNSIHKVDS